MSDDAKGDTAPAVSTENLVTLCAWSNTVRHGGEWLTFARYLERRFGLMTTYGISPKAIENFAAEDKVPAAGALKEPTRLAAVKAIGLLDTLPTAGFDRGNRLCTARVERIAGSRRDRSRKPRGI